MNGDYQSQTSTMTACPINFHTLGARLLPPALPPAPSTNMLARTPLLLILDLHGVLVQRVQISDRQELAESRQCRKAWRKLNKHEIWQRPHLRTFLAIATARHTVAIWSAALKRNINPLIEALSSDFAFSPSLCDRLDFITDRSICRPDLPNGRFAVIKYLPDLWRLHPRHSDFNTIIIDDTPSKIRDNALSAVVLPEYTPKNYGTGFNNEETLLWLLLYLEYLTIGAGIEFPNVGPSLGGIAASRRFLCSFETFCSMGFQEACRFSNSNNGRADVFFPPNVLDACARLSSGSTPALVASSSNPDFVNPE